MSAISKHLRRPFLTPDKIRKTFRNILDFFEEETAATIIVCLLGPLLAFMFFMIYYAEPARQLIPSWELNFSFGLRPVFDGWLSYIWVAFSLNSLVAGVYLLNFFKKNEVSGRHYRPTCITIGSTSLGISLLFFEISRILISLGADTFLLFIVCFVLVILSFLFFCGAVFLLWKAYQGPYVEVLQILENLQDEGE